MTDWVNPENRGLTQFKGDKILTTVVKVQNALAHSQATETDIILIGRLIKQVGKVAESFCNRYFLYGEYTEVFDGDSRKKLYLKGYPVLSITSLKIDDVEISSDDYQINKDLGEIYYSEGFRKGYQNVEVVYKTGYDAVVDGDYPPPDDIEGAVIDEVVARYAMLQTEPITVGSAERIVDLRTGFLIKSNRSFFESERNYA